MFVLLKVCVFLINPADLRDDASAFGPDKAIYDTDYLKRQTNGQESPMLTAYYVQLCMHAIHVQHLASHRFHNTGNAHVVVQ